MRNTILTILVIVSTLAACTESYTVRPAPVATQAAASQAAAQPAEPALATDGLAYVALPEDARYGETRFLWSGEKLAVVVVDALRRHLSRVEQAETVQTEGQALAAARQAGARYLVVPEILHWEDRLTGWSFKPDKVQVRLSIIDAASGAVLRRATLSGHSASVSLLGLEQPEDLLPKPVQDFVDTAF